MRVVGMIPVRLKSQRLPEKALAKIQGIPLILHTWKRCTYADRLDELFVVTDSSEIRDLVTSFGGKVLMTRSDHVSGSDRIAEAASNVEADIVVNIQGDEALVSPDHINELICHAISSEAPVSMLATSFCKRESPSDIKLVLNENGCILYASRTDIPHSKTLDKVDLIKAYHVVAFQKQFLIKFTSWQPSKLELIEGNEYLRIIEKGVAISTVLVASEAISVDTPSDLTIVDQLMANDKLFATYKSLLKQSNK